PLYGFTLRLQYGRVHSSYRRGQSAALCWNNPTYIPVAELAVGMRPLSRCAMQIAFSAPPSTGHRAAAHPIRRLEKAWMVSASRRTSGQGPEIRLATSAPPRSI